MSVAVVVTARLDGTPEEHHGRRPPGCRRDLLQVAQVPQGHWVSEQKGQMVKLHEAAALDHLNYTHLDLGNLLGITVIYTEYRLQV